MPIKLKANNGNIDLKVPIKQVGGGAVDSVNGMTGDVVLDIPSKTSQLENDSGFLTEHQSLSDYAKKSEIPDVSGFITEIPSEYVTETELEAKGYLTEHQSLSEYAKKSELFSKDYNDLTNKPTIPSVKGLASTQYVDEKVATKQDTLTAGSNITIKNGVISATGSSYTLPVADYDTLGGVKAKQTNPDKQYGIVCIDSEARLRIPIARQGVGENAGIVLPAAGQFKVEDDGDMFLLPASNVIGGVKADGTTTTVDTDGTIHAVMPEPYTLPTASTTTLGGVKVDGTSITIADGVISSTQPTKTSDLTNDSGFITNEYHDATKQNVLVAGDNITIADDGKTISASHPARYVNGADVSGNTLTLYYNNDTSVVFTPTGGSGGGSGGVSGYAFSSTQTFSDVDKAHLKEIYTNKNIYMTIDRLTVVRIMSIGAKRGFVVINTNGATSNQVLVYTVDIDSSLNVISDTFTLFMSYYLAGNSSALSGDIITSENWSQYISAGGGDWQYTTSSAESNLYNAKEMVLYWTDNYQHKHQTYLNFMADFNYNTGLTLGTGWTNTEIYLDADDSINHPFIQYNGTSILVHSCIIYFILYKT